MFKVVWSQIASVVAYHNSHMATR